MATRRLHPVHVLTPRQRWYARTEGQVSLGLRRADLLVHLELGRPSPALADGNDTSSISPALTAAADLGVLLWAIGPW